jgi:hypothetical protein
MPKGISVLITASAAADNVPSPPDAIIASTPGSTTARASSSASIYSVVK